MFTTAHFIPGISSHAARLALLALAVGLGLACAALPLPVAFALVAGPLLLAVIFVEPVVGLGLALVAAPLKAVAALSFPGLDPGQILLGVTIAAWITRGIVRRRIEIPRLPAWLLVSLAAFLIAAAVSLWYAPSLSDGLGELVKWAQVGAVAALALEAAEHNRLHWLLAAVFIAGLLQAGLGLWQFFLARSLPEHFRILGDHYRAFGTFEQPNPFGGFMGLAWPVATGLACGLWHVGQSSIATRRSSCAACHRSLITGHYSPTALFGTLAAVFLAALLLSFSRGAWLGAGAAAAVMVAFLPRRRAIGLGAVALILAGGQALWQVGLLPEALTARLSGFGDFFRIYDVRGALITDENYAVIQRLAFWQAAISMAAAHPWFGVGLGNYPAAYPAFSLLNWPEAIGHAHNTYLNMLAEVGLVGLFAYALFWIVVAGLTLRAIEAQGGWRRGLAVGLLGAWAHLAVHGLVDNLYVNNIHLFLGVFVGSAAFLGRAKAQLKR